MCVRVCVCACKCVNVCIEYVYMCSLMHVYVVGEVQEYSMFTVLTVPYDNPYH